MLPARAGSDSQSQSNLFRPDLFCLSVNIPDLESIQLTLARTCAVIVNVPDLKAYSSYAARNSDRVQVRGGSRPQPPNSYGCMLRVRPRAAPAERGALQVLPPPSPAPPSR